MDKVELPILRGDQDNERIIPLTVIVGLIVLILFFFFACFSITYKSTYKLHYSESSNLDYRVYLKPNNHFHEKYLPKNKQYISSLIDYIEADFDYSFKSDEKLDLEYVYYVTAKVSIDSLEGKNIYETKETIVNRKRFTDIDNDTFSVSEKVKIDYDKYNEEATKVLDGYDLTADASLVVTLNVEVLGEHAEFDNKLNDKEAITIKIPLSNKTVDINIDYNLSDNKDAILQYRSAIIKNPVLLYFSIFFAVLDVFAVIAVVAWIIYNRDEKVIYSKRLKKILKNYDRYISETIITERVSDMMKTRSLRIVVVKDFEGILDIRDNLGVPILYHEEKIGQEAVFYIINDNVGYIYVMRAKDLKRSIKNSKKDTKLKTEEKDETLSENNTVKKLKKELNDVKVKQSNKKK